MFKLAKWKFCDEKKNQNNLLSFHYDKKKENSANILSAENCIRKNVYVVIFEFVFMIMYIFLLNVM